MTMRTAWRWCAAIGIIAFICSGLFGRIPGLVACGPTGGLAPKTGCSSLTDVGNQAFVPYTADYFFYKKDESAVGRSH